MEHLDEEARKALELDQHERIKYALTSRFIPYPEAETMLEKFSDLVVYPDDDRPSNIMLVSETNNGKTSLLKHFQKLNGVTNIKGVGPQLNVLYVQTPHKADDSRLYTAILKALNTGVNGSDITANKQIQVENIIKAMGIRVLILDELHNAASGSAQRQRDFLVLLKVLSNDLQIGFICAGTQAAYDILSYEPQVVNRFDTYFLPTWAEKSREFVYFLKLYEQTLPLKKPSNLGGTQEIVSTVFRLGEGLLGEYVKILKYSAREAIRSGEERITLDVINKIKFTPPSKR